MLFPVILAGGHGSRLWPLSRQQHPKQFLPLIEESLSMLQATLKRLDGLSSAPPLLLCNEQHRFLAAEQVRQMKGLQAQIMLEPVGRNTAPAIALAALFSSEQTAGEQAEDAVLLALPADHAIEDVAAFHAAVNAALPLARAGKLVTFGIPPTRAETGYGYLHRGTAIGQSGSFEVAQFVEKPDRARAEAYLAAGDYDWNSGIFLFQAKRYLQELARFQPEVLAACQAALAGSERDLDFIRLDAEAFATCPDISVDYGVMEHTTSAAMVPLEAGWSDVGSWSALAGVLGRDEQGNTLCGDVLTEGVDNCLIHAESRLVAALGVENLVIVETKDAVLVAHKGKEQDVKRLVEQLEAQGRKEHIIHRECYRPWGKFDAIDSGKRYQVKRITVNPGARLSLQMHHHRAEHWVVVSGTARVTQGDQTRLLTENQSVYIPLGQQHALENPGKIPLELIEVQSGTYLGEDDIVRFEDHYGRG
ncbi:mannose-1-phosphate guanylyltransferase/mannose-6-phosphate isomerase [Oceanisphaera arctica]|uniref:mannose-1-phosphate guanylyltransferase n=1 Tax=Oceanisphaera arctica TaxID=641510 RepID=A0A2P5TLC4_9GAMM|nr:mannose-1-phosphate guanylyltransferase/mannose-6-phosphate isomerase [Oceanisphaera arctica]PPL16036.1 mannose-1-phosphate guanylyltransferase/mannose-6-phosphate isomerase [Oceanisphaera arctica]GHA15334.1 mannose-1-phosphate guanylyltransferase [Oceanisphaera arctica]